MSAGEAWSFGVAAVVSTGLVALWVWLYGVPKPKQPDDPPKEDDPPASSMKYLELERDRVLGAAKGIGSAAVGFLTVLVTAYFQNNPLNRIPSLFLVCYVVGAAGCIAVAAWISGQTREFVKNIKEEKEEL
jgi:hypothetical protein